MRGNAAVAPPSRHSNPFATCWTNPQAMQWLPIAGADPAGLTETLRGLGWRAQIVGPHGAGKSTLLHALRPHAEEAGRNWVRVDLKAGTGSSVWRNVAPTRFARDTLLVIDGFEQIQPLARRWIRWRCRNAAAGLLVTTHRPAGLPTLVELAPNMQAAKQLFRHLVRDHDTLVTEDDLSNAFNACNPNIRETLLQLYDMHEQYSRTADVANKERPQTYDK
jgi:hypothetical protein